jgi:signal peptidase II
LPYLALAFVFILLDRWTKALVLERIGLYESMPVIDGFFDITYVQNNGVAFGILNSSGSAAQTAAISLFVAAAVVAVVVYSVRSSAEARILQTALGLILGGALGNLYDRVCFGYVVDFLEFHWGQYRWPTFNIADSAISVGVFFLAVEILRHENPRRAAG